VCAALVPVAARVTDAPGVDLSAPEATRQAYLAYLAESLTATFFGPSWAPAVSFGVLLVTLAVRPSGILGR